MSFAHLTGFEDYHCYAYRPIIDLLRLWQVGIAYLDLSPSSN